MIYPQDTPGAWLTNIITSQHARSALAVDRNAAGEQPYATNDSMNLDDNEEEEDGNSDATTDSDAAPPLLPHVNINAPLESQLAYAAGSYVWLIGQVQQTEQTK